MMHKYFVTEVLDNICSKNTFQHFRGEGQVPLLPMSVEAHALDGVTRAVPLPLSPVTPLRVWSATCSC